MMFGYATDETKEFMPMTLVYSHKLVKRLADIRKKQPKLMPYLRPDAKSQVTVEYDNAGKAKRIDAIVISTQHDENVSQSRIKSVSYTHLDVYKRQDIPVLNAEDVLQSARQILQASF